MDGSFIDEKSSLKMLGLFFSFWIGALPYIVSIAQKSFPKESISFIQKDTIITGSVDLSETFNKPVKSIVKNLNIDEKTVNKTVCSNTEDPVLQGIEIYKCHPSVLRINRSVFPFKFVTEEGDIKEIRSLNLRKTCQDNNIPIKITNKNRHLFSHFLYHNFSNSPHSSVFPPDLKKADILLEKSQHPPRS